VGDPQLNTTLASGETGGQQLARHSAAVSSGELHDLPELPDTATELKSISRLLGAERTDILLGGSATEEHFRAMPIGEYQIIEFSTHGLIRGDIPGLSEAALVLTPISGGDNFNDGLLTATEIANLNLHARLVVLSACNTANFDPANFFTQVQGLTTAFAVSGVPTTIASLWPVESRTTEHLMVQLYKHLRTDSDSVAVALSKSMQDVIRDAPSRAYRHPRFWAPFIVLGDGGVKIDRSLQRPKIDNVIDVSDNVSEILGAAPAGNGAITSEIGPQISGRSPSLIRHRGRNGSPEWTIEDRNIGAGAIVRSDDVYFAAGYLWQGRSIPVLRGISGSGKVLWQENVPTKFASASVAALAPVPGGSVVALVTQFAPSEGDYAVEVHIFDSHGHAQTQQIITVPGRKFPQALTGRLLYSHDTVLLSIDYPRALTQGMRRNDFGLFETCYSGGGTFLFRLNANDLSVIAREFAPEMTINDLMDASGKTYFAGAKHRACSAVGQSALLGEIESDLSARTLWSAQDALDSRLTSLSESGDGIVATMVTQRTVNVHEYEPAANAAFLVPKEGPNRKRLESQSDSYSDAAILKFSEAGEVRELEHPDFGLPDDLHGLVRFGRSYAAYGDVGFNAWLAIAQ
jgi:hypothetical protein